MSINVNVKLALGDLLEGLSSSHVWAMLGWMEIRQRYRRSLLGPFWLTISTGAMIACIGFLYGRLFGQQLDVYFPYLAVSLVVWQTLAGMMNDSCQAFISAEGFIKQVKMPLSVHVYRVVWRNLIIFLHNLVIVVVVLLFFPPTPSWHLLMAPLGLIFLAINGVWFGTVLGLLCARFRDIPQIVASLVQVAFFVTPVMWDAAMLGKYRWAADLNPLFHLLELVRAPLLGRGVAPLSLAAVSTITLAPLSCAPLRNVIPS